MAMFSKPKFSELQDKYQDGVQYIMGSHSFKITLKLKTPNPTNILEYNWLVKLSDGHEFYVPMGPKLISYPNTRLGVIIEKLKLANRYQDDYLANAINDKIDEVYREYK